MIGDIFTLKKAEKVTRVHHIRLFLFHESGSCQAQLGSAPHTTEGDTHANLSRLKANLSRLLRESVGDRPDERTM
jgi:hypothetical protein